MLNHPQQCMQLQAAPASAICVRSKQLHLGQAHQLVQCIQTGVSARMQKAHMGAVASVSAGSYRCRLQQARRQRMQVLNEEACRWRVQVLPGGLI